MKEICTLLTILLVTAMSVSAQTTSVDSTQKNASTPSQGIITPDGEIVLYCTDITPIPHKQQNKEGQEVEGYLIKGTDAVSGLEKIIFTEHKSDLRLIEKNSRHGQKTVFSLIKNSNADYAEVFGTGVTGPRPQKEKSGVTGQQVVGTGINLLNTGFNIYRSVTQQPQTNTWNNGW